MKKGELIPVIVIIVLVASLLAYSCSLRDPHTVQYNLEEGVYYYFEAEGANDGWIKYHRNETDAVYVYGYYSQTQIVDNIKRYTVLKENSSLLNWFGWEMTWKGRKLFEFTNDYGEIKITGMRYSYIGEDPNYEVPVPIYEYHEKYDIVVPVWFTKNYSELIE